MALTAVQTRFVEEYLIDLNGRQAAIRAGYSPASAKNHATRLLRDEGVRAAVAQGRASRSKRVRIDADWVLRRLAEEAEADLAELYDEAGALKPVKDWPLVWRRGLVSGFEVEDVREEGAVIGTLRKVKLSDRLRRLELIGRHLGMFVERREVTGRNGGPIEHALCAKELSDDELANIALAGGDRITIEGDAHDVSAGGADHPSTCGADNAAAGNADDAGTGGNRAAAPPKGA